METSTESSYVPPPIIETRDAQDFITKIYNLSTLLKNDILACDAKWSLFVAAATSYRCNSQLKPFPPKYQTRYSKNFDKLVNTIKQISSLKTYLFNVEHGLIDELNPDVVDLLYWVLQGNREYELRTINEQEKQTLTNKYLQKTDPQPNYIFEVKPPSKSKIEERFLSNKEICSSDFGFHGSKIDSFYSILNNGLSQHMCKTALYGEGIYLSTELSHSLLYSPHGSTWGTSVCGPLISCVALCEYIKNPSYCITNEKQHEDGIPEKYILVRNNEMVRVRYLLFYVKPIAKIYSRKNAIINWMNNNKYLLAICCYVMFLMSLGISNYERCSYIRYFFA